MLLAASPGGVTANLFSHLARGDVALNITLTAVNSLLCLVTLPLVVGLSLAHFLAAERSVPVPYDKVNRVFAIVLVPVAVGMLARRFAPPLARALDRQVRLLSVVVLILAIALSLVSERERVMAHLPTVGLAALAFNLISLLYPWGGPCQWVDDHDGRRARAHADRSSRLLSVEPAPRRPRRRLRDGGVRQ